MNKELTEQLRIAEEIAREAHKGQKRWDGKDYITHIISVVDSAPRIEFKIVAWLHDVLEDSDFNIEHLKKRGIQEELISSVSRLTRLPNESYKEYILNVKKDKVATKVKIADLKHNLSNLKKGSMKDKYELALFVLEDRTAPTKE